MLSVAAATTVFDADTRLRVPPAGLRSGPGRAERAGPGAVGPPSVPKPDGEHRRVKTLAASLPAESVADGHLVATTPVRRPVRALRSCA